MSTPFTAGLFPLTERVPEGSIFDLTQFVPRRGKESHHHPLGKVGSDNPHPSHSPQKPSSLLLPETFHLHLPSHQPSHLHVSGTSPSGSFRGLSVTSVLELSWACLCVIEKELAHPSKLKVLLKPPRTPAGTWTRWGSPAPPAVVDDAGVLRWRRQTQRPPSRLPSAKRERPRAKREGHWGRLRRASGGRRVPGVRGSAREPQRRARRHFVCCDPSTAPARPRPLCAASPSPGVRRG